MKAETCRNSLNSHSRTSEFINFFKALIKRSDFTEVTGIVKDSWNNLKSDRYLHLVTTFLKHIFGKTFESFNSHLKIDNSDSRKIGSIFQIVCCL